MEKQRNIILERGKKAKERAVHQSLKLNILVSWSLNLNGKSYPILKGYFTSKGKTLTELCSRNKRTVNPLLSWVAFPFSFFNAEREKNFIESHHYK